MFWSFPNTLIGSIRATLDTPPNDQLRWEKTKTFDFGIDFAFFNYRLYGSIDYYNKQGSDLLSLVDLDPTTGWTSLNMNNAATRNRGFELQLNGEILRAANPQQVGLHVSASLWRKRLYTGVCDRHCGCADALQQFLHCG